MAEYEITITPKPKCCYECPMYVDKGWGDLGDYCHLTGKNVWDMQYRQRRRKDCPLDKENENG